MKSRLLLMSKIALAFVVLGFFLPILRIPLIGNLNGVDLAKMFSELGEVKYTVAIWFVPLFALVSIGIYLVSAMHGKDENSLCVVLDFCVLAGILAFILFSIISNMDDMSSDAGKIGTAIFREVLSIGAYAVALGWVTSLGFLVFHIMMHSTWDWDNLKKRIDALYVTAKKRIDTFPVVVQLLIGLLILAGIAVAGIFVLWLVDFVLLDADPIGRAFGLIR